MHPRRLALLMSTAVALAAGCGAPSGDARGTSSQTGRPGASSTGSASSTDPVPTIEPAPTSEPTPTSPTPTLHGKTVVLDPGHNGANAAHPQVINQQVPDGNGGTKACNTTGTSTDAGYPEHEMNWQIAIAVRDQLVTQGATVVLTRPDDAGVGPCVNERAAVGNEHAADAFVSIHGDGAAPSSRGFYCIVTPLAPGGPDVAAASLKLAEHLRDGIAATGVMQTAGYQGTDGIDATRTDLAGLNLSTRPSTLCELGNMRNPEDAAVQTSAEGQVALATGIVEGVVGYLST